MFIKIARKLAEGMRSPRATFKDLLGYVKYHAILARFPILVSYYRLKPISLDVPSRLCSCNPSVIDYEDGWMVIVRTHNWYVIVNGKIVDKLADSHSLINESWVSTYTKDFEVLRQVPLQIRDDGLPSADRDRFIRNGIADFRVFKSSGHHYLIGSGCNIAEKLDTMIIGPLVGDEFVAESIIESPRCNAVEKNWMPLDNADHIEAIYGINPLILVRIHDGKAKEIFSHKPVPEMPEYRGSSQALTYGNGRLCVVHRVIFIEWRRIYLHRLVYFSHSWNVELMSGEFFIEKKGIEFCAGLARKGDCYVISYGVDDVAARAVVLQKSDIERLLGSVDRKRCGGSIWRP